MFPLQAQLDMTRGHSRQTIKIERIKRKEKKKKKKKNEKKTRRKNTKKKKT